MPGLGEEVLDDHLLHVAVAAVGGGDGLQGLDPVGGVLADADEDAGGERDGEPPAASRVARRRAGALSGAPAVAVEVVAERLDHHPLARGDARRVARSARVEGAGVGVGEQPGLVEHEPRHGGEVVDGAAVAVLVEPLAGDRVAVLGCLAEGEEGLVAAGRGAGAGDGEDLLGLRYGDSSRAGGWAKVQ